MNNPAATTPTSTSESPPAAPPSLLRIIGCGAAMGIADAVPGVSGGTIALIAGIYERLIGSIHFVLRGILGIYRPDGRRELWSGLCFLIPLYLTAVIAVVVTLSLLVGDKPEAEEAALLRVALEDASGWLINPATAPIIFGYFFGLVVASISEPWRQRIKSRNIDWLTACFAAAIAAGLALSPASSGSTQPWALVGAGAIAVSVMLLPGISGSLALLVLGMYQPVASAVHERNLLQVLWFVSGMTIGAALFVPLLRQVLRHFHDRTMAGLSGLMAGSLVALWPWKAHYFPQGIELLGPMRPMTPSGEWWWPILASAAGVATIVASRRFGRRANHL